MFLDVFEINHFIKCEIFEKYFVPTRKFRVKYENIYILHIGCFSHFSLHYQFHFDCKSEN